MTTIQISERRENAMEVGVAVAISAVTVAALVALSLRVVSIKPLTEAQKFNNLALSQAMARGRNLFTGETLASLMDPTKSIDDMLTKVKPLGGGFFGSVDLWQGPNGKQVAIKEFRMIDWLGEWGGGAEVRASLVDQFQEFQIGLELDHPNFLKVHNLFVKELPGVETPRYYLLTEFIDGSTLAHSTILPDQVPGLLDEMISSMRHAVQKGIGPYDLHGNNAMITSGGHFKWIDFGCYRTPETLSKGSFKTYASDITIMLGQVARKGSVLCDQILSIWKEAASLPYFRASMTPELMGQLDLYLQSLQEIC